MHQISPLLWQTYYYASPLLNKDEKKNNRTLVSNRPMAMKSVRNTVYLTLMAAKLGIASQMIGTLIFSQSESTARTPGHYWEMRPVKK